MNILDLKNKLDKFIKNSNITNFEEKYCEDEITYFKEITKTKDNLIPLFYISRSGKLSDSKLEAKQSIDTNMFSFKIRSISRINEISRRLEKLNDWNVSLMEKVWELLNQTFPDDENIISETFDIFIENFNKFKDNKISNTMNASVLDCPYAFHITKFPSIDHFLLLSTAKGNACTARQLYGAFIRQLALFKSETEFVMLDTNCDGYLNEEELKSYVHDLIPTIIVLQDLHSQFYEFYSCSSVRRLFWELDPMGTGYISISKLILDPIMESWLDIQLAPEDLPDNWFGRAISLAIHDRFSQLNSSQSGMITLDEIKHYKKGLPVELNDGLPSHVSSLSTLFLERVFETMALFSGEMDYQCFSDFVIAVELLPKCPRPSFFWEILDFKNEGAITPMVVNLFFREVHGKLTSAGYQLPPIETILPEIFDIIPSKESLKITKEEFLNSNCMGLFTSLIIDAASFWQYETNNK